MDDPCQAICREIPRFVRGTAESPVTRDGFLARMAQTEALPEVDVELQIEYTSHSPTGEQQRISEEWIVCSSIGGGRAKKLAECACVYIHI